MLTDQYMLYVIAPCGTMIGLIIKVESWSWKLFRGKVWFHFYRWVEFCIFWFFLWNQAAGAFLAMKSQDIRQFPFFMFLYFINKPSLHWMKGKQLTIEIDLTKQSIYYIPYGNRNRWHGSITLIDQPDSKILLWIR